RSVRTARQSDIQPTRRGAIRVRAANLIQGCGMTEYKWQPVVDGSPPAGEGLFWVVPKTADETFTDTSGRPILSTIKPHIHVGTFGTWSSLLKATHWWPYPTSPHETEAKP
ncbi:MAG TPA: hypothetical protein VMS08_03520, partial [Candidatus Saccharimonadia bacterium]|nr:hypothetical protein [Candidatus Saccharimonadia bacterium]